ncbi:VWA domain-containing protein [Salinirubellus sp. GCM10025818]|uniref:VWA domain-containing protein n=1 Tax=Salinirubellus sp. GCM10025818 TaxID=3252688 RepID=UPI003613FBCE
MVLTPAVQTAAVLPADLEAILRSDATDLERAQAARLFDGVDVDFLVLITTRPAPLERIPLNDQLTADHAHQFGLAFHELLHILKTAILRIADLLDDEVDSEYHQQVHDLINIIEDGAIEREAIHGSNFSDNAGVRLELTRRIHSQTPDDIADDQQARFSFWDAVTSALYEAVIYPTGTTDVLLDETDDRIAFASSDDEDAFHQVHADLDQLAAEALSIRSTDPDDTTATHDKTASLRRAHRVIETWTSTLQSLIESRSTEEPETEGHGVEEPGPKGEGKRDTSQSALTEAEVGPTPESTGPGVSLDREATSNPYQDVLDQPSVTPDPDSTSIDSSSGADATTSRRTATDSSAAEVGRDSSGSTSIRDQDGASDIREDRHPGVEYDEGAEESPSRQESLAGAVERARERRQNGADVAPGRAGAGPADGERIAGQTSLDAFGSADPSSADDSLETPTESPLGESSPSGTALESPGDPSGVEPTEVDLWPAGPAHGADEPDSDHEVSTYEEALQGDREAAHGEAAAERLDQAALEREIDRLKEELQRASAGQSESEMNSARTSAGDRSAGGAGVGVDQLEDLEIVPVSDELVPTHEWDAVEDGAPRVAQILEKELALERQRGTRTGLTTGNYDTRAGHRLAIGDPRVCKTRIPGREKRYSLVLVLDRSGSMRQGTPSKIEVATQALARFAVAAEGLGIRVAVIDFIDGEARLLKPFSIETRHVQSTLLETGCGGGTPLADAIRLARTLVETQRDEPLIITVTDDQPSDAEAVKREVRASYTPVCSLTIATDCAPGTLGSDAAELAAVYERQAAVYTVEELDARLDQFASLLTGF